MRQNGPQLRILRIATRNLKYGFPIARTLANMLSAANIARVAALTGAGMFAASRAVLFSGSVFVIALTGMLLVPSNIMKSLAVGAIAVGFVLGLPINMDGSEGPRAQSTRAFARNFSKLTDFALALWDERLSTVAVERDLIGTDMSRARRAERVDADDHRFSLRRRATRSARPIYRSRSPSRTRSSTTARSSRTSSPAMPST